MMPRVAKPKRFRVLMGLEKNTCQRTAEYGSLPECEHWLENNAIDGELYEIVQIKKSGRITIKRMLNFEG